MGGGASAYSSREVDGWCRSLEVWPVDARTWYKLGTAGGGIVSSVSRTNVDCYCRALELQPEHEDAWYAWRNLGMAGGGKIHGNFFTKMDCYCKVLEMRPDHADAWCNLGVIGGGVVNGITYTQLECLCKALEVNPDDANTWYNIGVAGGGTVNGRSFNQVDCLLRALELQPTDADAWYNLGVAGGGVRRGETFTKEACFKRALELRGEGEWFATHLQKMAGQAQRLPRALVGPRRRLNVLAIDSGGIRGVVPAMILAAMEQQLGLPIHEVFDIIGGSSSAGGLLAALVGGLHQPAEEAVDIWRRAASMFFSSGKNTGNMSARGYVHPDANMERALSNFMSAEDFGRNDWPSDKPKVFLATTRILKPLGRVEYLCRNYEVLHHDAEKSGTCKLSLKDACRATAAAPSYFPKQKIMIDGKLHYFEDGALLTSNPSKVAILEALKAFPGAVLGCLVSIGTGRLPIGGLSQENVQLLEEESLEVCSRTEDTDGDLRSCLQLASGGDLLQELHYYRLQFDLPKVAMFDNVKEISLLQNLAKQTIQEQPVMRIETGSRENGPPLASADCLLYKSLFPRA